MMKPIIGLEVHVQLKTKSKMFCSCSADYFGQEPNTHMCPVCLGLPGALPVANKKALEQAIKVGLALHCHINNFSKFDRKNYMYPDLFKGYQITQYDIPVCENGYVDLKRGDGSVLRVGIIRAHQEEDTAKSIHEDGYTLVDGNKAGVPLLEIVSAPDMASVEEARLFAEYIYHTLRFIGVTDADMEKGQLRFDVNVNLQISDENKDGVVETIATPIVEIKNLNSFRSLERALEHEIERQYEEYKNTGVTFAKGNKTTRGWNDDKGSTYLLRSKEEAEDYRYFPEPDIPPVVFTDEQIASLQSEIGELAGDIYDHMVESLHFTDETARFFTTNRVFYDFFAEARKHYPNLKNLANWIKGELAAILYEKGETGQNLTSVLPVKHFIELLQLIDEGKVSGTAAKEVLRKMIETKEGPEVIIQREGLGQISDTAAIASAVERVIAANPSAVENFSKGKAGALMFLVGQVMREMKGKGNPAIIKEMMEKKLAVLTNS